MRANIFKPWYKLYYSPCHNPIYDAFSLANQWLVTTPVAILDKAQAWEKKAKQFEYNLVPCPENPFQASFDPFRDHKEYKIAWAESDSEWHRANSGVPATSHLVNVLSSLLFDLGYYYDAYSTPELKDKEGLNDKFQFIHKSGVWLLQIQINLSNSSKAPVGKNKRPIFQSDFSYNNDQIMTAATVLQLPKFASLDAESFGGKRSEMERLEYRLAKGVSKRTRTLRFVG